MAHLSSKFTPHTIAIGLSSLTLLALSIALIVLESRVQNAFQDQGRQYPGSNIAEFLFVPLNPSNIDAGPTVMKFAVGACSLAVSLLGIAWVVLHWCRACGMASMVHVRLSFPKCKEIETELCIGQDDRQRCVCRSHSKHRCCHWHYRLRLHDRGAGPSSEVLQSVGQCEFHARILSV
jgi:hypothetical protein